MNKAAFTPAVIVDREKYLIAALIARATAGANRSRVTAVDLARTQYELLDEKVANTFRNYLGNQIEILRWAVAWDQVAEGKLPQYSDIMVDLAVTQPQNGSPCIPQARFLGVYALVSYYIQHLGSTGYYNILAVNGDTNTIDVVMLSDASELEEFQAGLKTRYDGNEHAFEMAQAFIYNFYNAE